MSRVQFDVTDDIMVQQAAVWDEFNLRRVPFYKRFGQLMELRDGRLATVSRGRLIEVLGTIFEMVKPVRNGTISAMPRSELLTAILDGEGRAPTIRRIAHAPTFLENGDLLDKPGYRDGVLYLDSRLRDGMEFDPHPDDNQIIDAIEIVQSLLVDFPFREDCDKAHALSLLILPFMRDIVKGPTPLHIIEAPVSNTGKSLLARALLYPATGRWVEGSQFAPDEDERRKALTGALIAGSDVMLWDDVSGSLSSNVLQRALTSDEITDRILGGNRIVNIPTDIVWALTSNNARISSEIGRRSIRIRLDAGMAQPGLRDYTSFKHPDLRKWLTENRSDIVWAVITLVNAWKMEGQFGTGRAPLPSFEEWSQRVGGIIVNVLGEKGWLKHQWLEEDVDDLTEFVAAWAAAFQSQAVRASSLVILAAGTGFIEGRATANHLARKLGQHRDNRVGGWIIRDLGRTADGRFWRLERDGDGFGVESVTMIDAENPGLDSDA